MQQFYIKLTEMCLQFCSYKACQNALEITQRTFTMLYGCIAVYNFACLDSLILYFDRSRVCCQCDEPQHNHLGQTMKD